MKYYKCFLISKATIFTRNLYTFCLIILKKILVLVSTISLLWTGVEGLRHAGLKIITYR
jgi:hypothetical protein